MEVIVMANIKKEGRVIFSLKETTYPNYSNISIRPSTMAKIGLTKSQSKFIVKDNGKIGYAK